MIINKGRAMRVYFNKQIGEEVLEIYNKKIDKKILIPKSEIVDNKEPIELVKKLIDYVEIDENTGSMKKAMPYKRERIIEKSKNGEKLNGEITYIANWGAYISIEGVNCVIRNCDFASDSTIISDLYKVGDSIDGLRYIETSSYDRICLEKVDKYSSGLDVNVNKLKQGSIVVGTIRNIKVFGCFVAVANDNKDALCSIPKDMEIEEGMKVKCKITVVDLDNNKMKLRGKIVDVINNI